MASNPNTFKPTSPKSAYKQARALLGNRSSRKLANNTYLLGGLPDSSVIVAYHGSPILIYHPNGTITVSTCGWHTYTTKERINWFLPRGCGVIQKNYELYLYRYAHARPFKDGMVLR